MKMMLSMPRTISSAVSVSSPTSAFGSVIQSIRDSLVKAGRRAKNVGD